MGATEVCGLDGDLTTITIEGRKSLQNAKYVHTPVPPPPNNLPFFGPPVLQAERVYTNSFYSKKWF
jgi:hypothetical protein